MNGYTKAYIPYGGYYSTPFCRWQGSMQHDNAVSLGAATARRWFLEKRKIDPTVIDYLYFGATVAQNHWFCAHNWAGAILTDDKKFVPGLFINQACSTSTTFEPGSESGALFICPAYSCGTNEKTLDSVPSESLW